MLHTFRARRSFHRMIGKSRGKCLFIEIIGQNHATITFITKNKVKKSKKIVKITSRLRIVRPSESLKKGQKLMFYTSGDFFFDFKRQN